MKLSTSTIAVITGLALTWGPAAAGTLSIPGLTPAGANGIEILSWSWGVSNGREAGSGMATGKRQHEPIVITKQIDKASPLLMRACQSGQVFPQATAMHDGKTLKLTNVKLTACTTSGNSERFTVVFSDVLVSS